MLNDFDEEEALLKLLQAGLLFVIAEPGDSEFRFEINCNDTFYFACADGEPLKPSDLRPFYELYMTHGDWAGTMYASLKRGMRPQPPVMQRMREAGVWTDALEALPARSHAECCGCPDCFVRTVPVP